MRATTGDTLERLVPEAISPDDTTGRASLALHLERYRFAAAHLRPGRVLDLACGVGYGAALLADRPDVEVVGVDRSEYAIASARRHHPGPRLEFRVDDALAYEDPSGFDTIVSLETIEHVSDPGRLIARLARLLRPGGVLIASVPTTPSTDINPHHLHDFSARSFRRLVARCAPGLREIDALDQVQRVSAISVLRRSAPRLDDRRRSLPAYYLAHPGAFVRRVASTLRFGFANRYLVIAWKDSSTPCA